MSIRSKLASIRWKLALAFSGLALLALFFSLVACREAVRRAAIERLEQDVQRAAAQFNRLIDDLAETGRRQIDSVVTSEVYARALSQAGSADDELGLEDGSPEERARRKQEALAKAHELFLSADLTAVREGAQRDSRELLVLLNASGEVVYNDAEPESHGQKLDKLRLVAEALGGGTAADLWSSEYLDGLQPRLAPPAKARDLFLVVGRPVRRGDAIIGAMLLGQPVSSRVLPALANSLLGTAQVALQSPDGALVSSNKGLELRGVEKGASGLTTIELAGQQYLMRSGDALYRDTRLGRMFVLLSLQDELDASLNTFWRWMAPMSLLTLVLAGVVARFLSKWLADPLVALAAAAQKVGQGDLTVEVRAYGEGEVARLATAFNEMVSGLRQRDQIKGLFKRYLNPAVVEELIRHPEKASPGGERRHLTVLFSDLVGFTTLSERMSPEELVALLNEYFEQATQVLAARGATFDKFIGDAIMCFWNAPLPQEEHAALAAQTALELLAVVDRLRVRFAERGVKSFECRIGINTGPCIVGFIGSTATQEYTVIGDTVNLASRLEGAAKVYGTRTLVAQETVDGARGVVRARELDLVRVKGKIQPVRVYELLGPASQEPPPHVAVFARGLELYRARRFAEALDVFGGIASVDAPARLFHERCQRLLAEPPGPEWDGVHTLDSK